MRLHYIDGLKALGAIIVFFCHFNGLLSAFHISDFLKIIANGEYAVGLFLMLSGFSIALSLDKNSSWDKLRRIVLFRYFRFAIPLGVVATIAYFLYLTGGFYNTEVANITGHAVGREAYTNLSPFHYIASLLLSPMGYNALDAPLWMLKYIFEGTFLIVALHISIKDMGFFRKMIVLTAASILSAVQHVYFADIVMGMMLFELNKNFLQDDKHILIKNILSIALLLISFYIGNHFGRINGTVDRLHGIMVAIGAFTLILSVLSSKFLQRLLSTKPFKFFGSISFEIYIIHWIVVCSFSSFLFLNFGETIPIYLNLLLTTTLIVLLSLAMTRWIEPKLIQPTEVFLQKKLIG